MTICSDRLVHSNQNIKGRTVSKPESEWNNEEIKAATSNYTALHAIQCGVEDRNFRLITSLESEKEAWDIL